MLLKDRIYSECEIKEEVLIDLINSPSLQRLKGISQLGLPEELYYKKTFSRFEHSIGVLILLRKLEVDIYEQIAGLVHDISHTAFSHVIDWAIGDPVKEDYQDNNFLKFLKNSEIPSILKKHRLSLRKIENLKYFTILEQNTPKLCADRLDYSLRELDDLDIPKLTIEKIVGDLKTKDGQIVFKNRQIAEEFANYYMYLQTQHWAGNKGKAHYYLLSKILKEALKKKYITLNDFLKTDKEVLEILYRKNDKSIKENLDKLKKGFIVKEKKKKTGLHLKKKFRYIDPEVLINDDIKRLSSVSNKYKDFLEKERKKGERVVYLEIT